MTSRVRLYRGLGIGTVVVFIAALGYTLMRPAMQPPPTNMDKPQIAAHSPAASAPAANAAPTGDIAPAPSPIVTRTGSFRGTGHMGSGGVTITTAGGKTTLHLVDDFYVTPGPDLYIGFGNNDLVDKNALIATLKTSDGAGDYAVPDGINTEFYAQVIIYCKAYGYEFSVATLN